MQGFAFSLDTWLTLYPRVGARLNLWIDRAKLSFHGITRIIRALGLENGDPASQFGEARPRGGLCAAIFASSNSIDAKQAICMVEVFQAAAVSHRVLYFQPGEVRRSSFRLNVWVKWPPGMGKVCAKYPAKMQNPAYNRNWQN